MQINLQPQSQRREQPIANDQLTRRYKKQVLLPLGGINSGVEFMVQSSQGIETEARLLPRPHTCSKVNWIHSISNTWEPGRNANSQLLAQIYRVRNSVGF